jgi:hypothetical protein
MAAGTSIGRQVSHFYIIRSLGNGGMGVVVRGAGHAAPALGRVKFPTTALSRNGRGPALQAGGAPGRVAESPEYLHHPRRGRGRRPVLHRDGAAARPDAQGAPGHGPIPLAELITRVTGRGCPRRGARPGHHPPRHHPGQRVPRTAASSRSSTGLAKHFAADENADGTDDLTVTGAIAGTIITWRERLAEDGAVDYRCDPFSLGVILYQMATGTRLFEIGPGAR